MSKRFYFSWIVSIVVLLFVSTSIHANPLAPYVILEAEYGDRIGDSFSLGDSNGQKYVIVQNGRPQDTLSMLLDISSDQPYEFWFYIKGTGTAKVDLYHENGQRLINENLEGTTDLWHWVQLKKNKQIAPGRYYLTLTNFKGDLQIDKAIVNCAIKPRKATNPTDQSQGDITLMSEPPAAPVIAMDSPWTKQGLNPFAAVLQNGSEFVSTTAGVLTVSRTDLVVPGRNGLDLVIGATYSSRVSSQESPKWESNFPSIEGGEVHLPTGGVCNIYDDDVVQTVEILLNGDKIITYINTINCYFKLSRYEKYTGNNLFGYPQYQLHHYELYLSDGTVYNFNQKGKIELIQSRNIGNSITFTYDQSDRIYQIRDSLGKLYKYVYSTCETAN